MAWKNVLYAIACIVAPLAWGLVIVWATTRIERATRRGSGRKSPDPTDIPPIEYHI